jgi:hypothetical protein
MVGIIPHPPPPVMLPCNTIGGFRAKGPSHTSTGQRPMFKAIKQERAPTARLIRWQSPWPCLSNCCPNRFNAFPYVPQERPDFQPPIHIVHSVHTVHVLPEPQPRAEAERRPRIGLARAGKRGMEARSTSPGPSPMNRPGNGRPAPVFCRNEPPWTGMAPVTLANPSTCQVASSPCGEGETLPASFGHCGVAGARVECPNASGIFKMAMRINNCNRR